MSKKTFSKIAALVLCSSLFAAALFLPTQKIRAQNPFNFGGMVVFDYFCDCSGNFYLFITPPKGGGFMYDFGGQYANYMLPSSGVWTKGLYEPFGICLEYHGEECDEILSPDGTISETVGTSY